MTKHFLFAAVAVALLTTPADAQIANKGYEFVEAVRKDDGNKVKELLEQVPFGLIDARGMDGETALTLSLARRDVEWTAFLLSKGADPNLKSRDGDPPIVIAGRAGFAEAVGWLLGLGAEVDATNSRGETALIGAVQSRSVPTVKKLLQSGADPDRADAMQGYSARDYAKRDPRARDILKAIELKKP